MKPTACLRAYRYSTTSSANGAAQKKARETRTPNRVGVDPASVARLEQKDVPGHQAWKCSGALVTEQRCRIQPQRQGPVAEPAIFAPHEEIKCGQRESARQDVAGRGGPHHRMGMDGKQSEERGRQQRRLSPPGQTQVLP